MGGSLIKEIKHLLGSQQYSWSVRSTGPSSTILYDQHSRIQAERFSIDYSLIQHEWTLYVLRKNNPKYLVTVYDLIQEREESICASNREVGVVIELIPYRLCDLGALTFQEAMYIIKCVTEGYKTLAKNNIPYYLLDQAAICFTKTGICKFWINQNLQLARPNTNRLISEQQFTASLLEMVEMRVTRLPQSYTNERQRAHSLSIEGLLELVQHYRESQVRCMASLCGLFSPQSTKYHSNCKEGVQHKVSIAKSTRNNRRQRHQRKETPRFDYSQPKKLSLSFSKHQRKEVQARLESNSNPFVSPGRYLLLSEYSSRQNSHLQSNCFVSSRSITHK